MKYSQAGRWLKLHTPLGDDVLLLESIRGVEAASELFRFELRALAQPGSDVSFEKLLGEPISVTLEQAGEAPRYFHGIVESIEEAPPGEEFTEYDLVMVPRFWLWTRRVQSRIFQNQTIPDILRIVLKGLDVVYELEEPYAPHNYCVQYQESDFAFASRLMEEAGIYYYFRHAADAHKLVLADHSANGPLLPAQTRVPFDAARTGTRKQGRIHDWRKRQQVRSTRTTVRDYSLAVPDQTLEATQRGLDQVSAGDVTHTLAAKSSEDFELFDFAGRYAHRVDVIDPTGTDHPGEAARLFEEARQVARLRMEEETAEALSITGAGTCSHFLPGYRFTLSGLRHADGSYWIRHVEHAAESNSYRSGSPDLDRNYTNRFICIPEALPYRPARLTPRPKPDLQTAVVVGVPGEEITTDKYGRIKVRFRWDRQSAADHRSSCWVRIAQPWAGKGWGMTTLPRVGQEVVVDFLDGDPDGPLVIGSVYNNEQMPPFAFPQERTRSGLKAQTAGAGGDPSQYSGVGFETESGSELVRIRSQRNRFDTVNASQRQSVNTNKNSRVGRFHSQVVGGLQTSSQSTTSSGSGQGGGDGGTSAFFANATAYSGIQFGSECSCVVGSQASTTIGTQFSNSINPLSALEIGDVGGVLGKLAAPASSALGSGTVVVGGISQIVYGSNVAVQRGPNVQYTRDQTWEGGLGNELCAGLLGCFILAEVGQSFMLAQVADSESWTGDDFAVGIYTALTQLLYVAEVCAEVMTLTDAAGTQAAAQATTAATTTPAPASTLLTEAETYVFALGWAISMLGEVLVGALGTSGEGSGGGSGDSAAGETAPPSHFEARQVPYQVSATTVVLNAAGNGDGTVFPSCTLFAGNAAAAACITAEVAEAFGRIVLDCGPEGMITLQSGLEMTPNFIMMSLAGINVSSDMLISLTSVENNVVIDPEEGITLEAFENLVTMSEAGIVMASGGSIVTIAPEGITIESNGATVEIGPSGIVLNGVTIEISAMATLTLEASAELTLDGALITAG